MKFTISDILFDSTRDFSYRKQSSFYAEKIYKVVNVHEGLCFGLCIEW